MGGRSEDKRAKRQKQPRPEPNLELPSLPSLRRRRRKPSPTPAEPSPFDAELAQNDAEPSLIDVEPAEVVARPARKLPPPPPRPTPAPPVTKRVAPPPPPPRRRVPPAPPGPPPPPATLDVETTAVLPAVESAPEPTKPRRAPKPPKEPKAPKPPKAPRQPKPPKAPKPAKPAKPPKQPKVRAPRVRRERSTEPLPWFPPYLAAILTGALCGGLTVTLAWATGQACSAVRGVGTCGGYGVFALVAILGIDVVIATGLLRLFRVVDPATTSMLGVGLVAVLAMVFFLGETQSFAMVYVIPILMAVTFWFAWWVTKAIAARVED